MKVLLIQEGDSVVVKIPTPGTNFEEFAQQNPGATIVDQATLPKTREFRDAWTVNGTVDIEKAKEVWKNKIRSVRNKRLQDLDIEWMKAMEKGQTTIASAISADKQVLRDITKREELTKAKTVEEIKAFWPKILEG